MTAASSLEEEAPPRQERSLLAGLRFSGEPRKKRRRDEQDEKKVGLWFPEQQQRRPQLPSAPVVGDGGASYRASALRRAMEEAERSGRSLREVVAERWGSLEELLRGMSVDEALSFERAPPKQRSRRREFVLTPAAEGGALTDAQILRQYAADVEHKRVDLSQLSSRRRGGDDDDAGPTVVTTTKYDDQGGSGWNGLSSRTGFAMGKGTFDDGWRGAAAADTPPRRREGPSPPAPAPPEEESSASKDEDASSNANVAALLRARLGRA